MTAKKKAGGRPTKCDEERVRKLCDLISVGNYLSVACRIVGIDTKTLRNWRDRAAAGDSPYVEYFPLLKKADAEAEKSLLAKVRSEAEAGNKCWSAFMTIMSRRWPQRWGENRVEVKEVKEEQKKLRAEMEAMKGARAAG